MVHSFISSCSAACSLKNFPISSAGTLLFFLLAAPVATGQTNVAPMAAMTPVEPAPATTPPMPNNSAAGLITSMDALNDQTKLTSGDMISYRVTQEQKQPVELEVSASGEVEIPLLGRYQVTGKTCKQVAEELKPLLEKDYFYHANVIIGLDSISNQSPGRVYFMGSVRSQGAISLPPNESLTLSKAILLNGGLGDFADWRKVKLVRKKEGGGTDVQIIDLIKILKEGHSELDPVLQPDDTIMVPEKLINF